MGLFKQVKRTKQPDRDPLGHTHDQTLARAASERLHDAVASRILAATTRMEQVADEARLAETGVNASATVVSLHEFVSESDDAARVEATVLVLPADGIPYTVVTTTWLGHPASSTLAPGRSVRVRVDPDDPAHVVVV